MAETKEKPPRAEAISAIARVHELADRLQEAARACIEPPLGTLQVRGIVTHGDGDGVVLFRTAASLTGPHRVAGDGHAFIRRGPSSVQMTMREIQDLTLDLARGADRLDALFGARAALFVKWLQSSSSEEQAALRITAVPLGNFPTLARIPADSRGLPFSVRSQHDVVLDGNTIQCTAPSYQAIRPIVRGGAVAHRGRFSKDRNIPNGASGYLVSARPRLRREALLYQVNFGKLSEHS
jgi:hypothetical protein